VVSGKKNRGQRLGFFYKAHSLEFEPINTLFVAQC